MEEDLILFHIFWTDAINNSSFAKFKTAKVSTGTPVSKYGTVCGAFPIYGSGQTLVGIGADECFMAMNRSGAIKSCDINIIYYKWRYCKPWIQNRRS